MSFPPCPAPADDVNRRHWRDARRPQSLDALQPQHPRPRGDWTAGCVGYGPTAEPRKFRHDSKANAAPWKRTAIIVHTKTIATTPKELNLRIANECLDTGFDLFVLFVSRLAAGTFWLLVSQPLFFLIDELFCAARTHLQHALHFVAVGSRAGGAGPGQIGYDQ